MSSNKLMELLNSNKRIYGTAIVSPSTLWPLQVKTFNLDFVFIDTEHIALNRETVSNMCNVYSALGLPPIVRIPSPDPYLACTVLDGGASGILAPYIESIDEIKKLVGAVKYRPIKGKKLDQIINNPNSINKKLKKYIDDRCKNNLLLINIESEPALENLADLLSVKGLDGVIIGPHDLSFSMGLPEEYNHPDFEKAVQKIIDECRKRKLRVGIHLSEEPEQQIKWAKKGVNIILHSSDISLFRKAMKNDLTKIKAALNDSKIDKDSNSIII